MKKKRYYIEFVIFLILIFAILGVFFFGITHWVYYKENYTNKFEKNLYYITISSVMYLTSFLVLLMSKTFLYKVFSSILVSVFGCNLYIELFLNPMEWTKWDLPMIIIVALNILVVNFLIEKIKSKKHEQ